MRLTYIIRIIIRTIDLFCHHFIRLLRQRRMTMNVIFFHTAIYNNNNNITDCLNNNNRVQVVEEPDRLTVTR